MTDITPETVVPPGEAPAASCPYCDRPFSSERSCALHVGEVHRDVCTDAEIEAYEQACDAEEDDLFGFHMKVFVAIGIIHAVLIALYMIAFGSGLI